MNTYKIIIDTKGSDKGPATVIKGAAMALEKYKNLSVALAGDRDFIEQTARELGMDKDRYEIIEGNDEITNYDSPAEALFTKPDASMIRALEALSARDDIVGMINAGSTGALIAGAMRYLSGKNRVRPALCAVLPHEQGGFTCLCDTGATIDCTPEMLVHFARLGADFMRKYYNIENPRIGLLSNGSEPTKGNKAVKAAHALISADEALSRLFIGNVEGSSALGGVCDVLVADGFAGNQVLKVTKGIATRIITDIVKYAKRKNSPEIMELVGELMGIYDFNSLGGGIILGIEKPVIKAFGASNEKSIVSVVGIMLNMVENKDLYDQGT